MPELIGVYDRLVALAGGTDRAARFLSTWCPPSYLGGCSLAAVADDDEVRLVRNYDLSPELNEGLLLRSEWTGRPVMGMVEFLWGLSDGINDAGLSVALAYGGRSETAEGFGITTILRYLLETCDTVAQAIAALRRVPSHMAYNLVLADASGRTASVELSPGGSVKLMPQAIATNHQSGPEHAERPTFLGSFERLAHLKTLRVKPSDLIHEFLTEPLIQHRYAEGFGTLFTAEYDPKRQSLCLTIKGDRWTQTLDEFHEGQRIISYTGGADAGPGPGASDGVEDRRGCHAGPRAANDWLYHSPGCLAGQPGNQEGTCRPHQVGCATPDKDNPMKPVDAGALRAATDGPRPTATNDLVHRTLAPLFLQQRPRGRLK
jgi:predicted choloylglycine hydrolase